MVNDAACPEMRQNDRASPVGKGMRGGQKSIERRFFRDWPQARLAVFLPGKSRPRTGGRGPKTGNAKALLSPRDRYAPVFRKCRRSVIGTLLFVRRNDILLQRGMALQVVPLPSLGVSSLDLGRSDPFERPLFYPSGMLFGCGARNRKPDDARHEGAHHGFEVAAQSRRTRPTCRSSSHPYKERG